MPFGAAPNTSTSCNGEHPVRSRRITAGTGRRSQRFTIYKLEDRQPRLPRRQPCVSNFDIRISRFVYPERSRRAPFVLGVYPERLRGGEHPCASVARPSVYPESRGALHPSTIYHFPSVCLRHKRNHLQPLFAVLGQYPAVATPRPFHQFAARPLRQFRIVGPHQHGQTSL